jgi:glycosyltransferase involved in cell wall biosynthesis
MDSSPRPYDSQDGPDSSQRKTASQDAGVPLVSVITPTWHRRHGMLLGRCIPSVRAQDYPEVEHVVVSDGPDDDLAFKLGQQLAAWGETRVIYREMVQHDPEPHWGHWARLAGIEASQGEYITYVDDDDALRPEHCSRMAAALEAAPEAGFAVSRMTCHGLAHKSVTGWGPLAPGNVGTPMLMHRRGTLEHGTWGPASFTEDWDLVERWLDAGVRYVSVDAETSDVYPARYRRPEEEILLP